MYPTEPKHRPLNLNGIALNKYICKNVFFLQWQYVKENAGAKITFPQIQIAMYLLLKNAASHYFPEQE